MKDRVSTYPGRVLITPESGEPYYATLTRADEPTQVGDPLNKATLLKDFTAKALGLTSDAVPDDAFLALIIGADNYGIRIHAQLPNGAPVPGARITGVNDIYGNALYTDDSGDALGVASSATGSFTVQSVYIDIANASQSYSLTQKITEITVTLTQSEETEREYTSSQSGLRFSPYVSAFDACLVGGGGGGGTRPTTSHYVGGSGGGGGYVTNALSIPANLENTLNITIGSGGYGGTSGSNGGYGGSTTLTYGENSYTASGGGPGRTYTGEGNVTMPGGGGNGSGGNGGNHYTKTTDGTDGTGYKFGDTSLGVAGGGGGGGASGQDLSTSSNRRVGGSPNGGDAGYLVTGGASANAQAGEVPGGGGGGGFYSSGGRGGNGIAYIRWEATA